MHWLSCVSRCTVQQGNQGRHGRRTRLQVAAAQAGQQWTAGRTEAGERLQPTTARARTPPPPAPSRPRRCHRAGWGCLQTPHLISPRQRMALEFRRGKKQLLERAIGREGKKRQQGRQ